MGLNARCHWWDLLGQTQCTLPEGHASDHSVIDQAAPELPEWAQERVDHGLCAILFGPPWTSSEHEGWCVTHGEPEGIAHALAVNPNMNLD